MTAAIRIGAERGIRLIAVLGLLAAGIFPAACRAESTNEVPVSVAAAVLGPFAKGPIEKLDLANKLMTIRTATGPRTFEFTDRTYMFCGKDRITADKLATGETVAVRIAAAPGGTNRVVRLKAYPTALPTVPTARPEGGAP